MPFGMYHKVSFNRSSDGWLTSGFVVKDFQWNFSSRFELLYQLYKLGVNMARFYFYFFSFYFLLFFNMARWLITVWQSVHHEFALLTVVFAGMVLPRVICAMSQSGCIRLLDHKQALDRFIIRWHSSLELGVCLQERRVLKQTFWWVD